MAQRAVRMVVVDDMADTRTLLAGFLAETDGVHVVGTAADQLEAVELVREVRPDLIVVDVDFPDGINGPDLIAQFVDDCPSTMVVALSSHGAEHEDEALAAGASVFFPKESIREVVESVRAVVDDMLAGRLK